MRANALRLVQSKKSESTATNAGKGKSPAPFIKKIWKHKMLTTIGPSRSNPNARVRGQITKMPPTISSTFTTVK